MWGPRWSQGQLYIFIYFVLFKLKTLNYQLGSFSYYLTLTLPSHLIVENMFSGWLLWLNMCSCCENNYPLDMRFIHCMFHSCLIFGDWFHFLQCPPTRNINKKHLFFCLMKLHPCFCWFVLNIYIFFCLKLPPDAMLQTFSASQRRGLSTMKAKLLPGLPRLPRATSWTSCSSPCFFCFSLKSFFW